MPESRSLSELTRQIAPPTKNGHAPPPTESRKSYQSVNPFRVRAGYSGEKRARFEHSNFFKVNAPSPVRTPSQGHPGGTGRQGLRQAVDASRRTASPLPTSNYELFNCSNFNIRYWSWNYRGCWHQTCPPMGPHPWV
ncbi:hypothetical protein P4O66_019982 [Electrophorus voltai]|uniref:Uncharacterized protein n=1 Tax=Electrophorus voltai TaxID=2609070 RepID=A0AAD9DKY8_9TELE|nr:hypothetical protein P4O66_019982 [Electrophorus voltai]